MNDALSVALIGPGAVGGVVAAGLARGGARVVPWGRSGPQTRIAPVRFSEGGAWPETQAAPADRPPEVVVVAVKAGDMADALQRARQIAPDAPVVPLVNGVPFWLLPRLGRADLPGQLRSLDRDGRLTGLAKDLQFVGAVVLIPAERVEGGVETTGTPKLVIERGGGAPLDRLEAALTAGGIAVDRPDDLMPALFDKLMGNAVLNPLTAITGLTVGQATTALAAQARRGMAEVVAVAQAMGVDLRPDLDARIERAARLTGHSTSMLQDRQAGKPTEIDAITGATVELAGLLGVDTPVLSLLHGLVAATEAAAP